MKLLLFAVAGLLAQLVDGALGMAFGITATTALILSGAAPAQASAAVHFAEVGTTLFSGLAHWRLRNVHWPTVLCLGVPGAVGAFAGATVLSGMSGEAAEPVVSCLLLLLGAYVLVRSIALPWRETPERAEKRARRRSGGDSGELAGNVAGDLAGESSAEPTAERHHRDRRRLGLVALGLGGGFLDATGGGGWGPVTTSTLLSVGRREPRLIIGTVNTAEFLVAVSASLGFLFGLEQVHGSWQPVVGLLVGGALGAPVAAWVVTVVRPDILGGLVGALLVVLNGIRVVESAGVPGALLVAALAIPLSVLVAVTAVRAFRRRGREGREGRGGSDGHTSAGGVAADRPGEVVDNAGAPASGAFTTG